MYEGIHIKRWLKAGGKLHGISGLSMLLLDQCQKSSKPCVEIIALDMYPVDQAMISRNLWNKSTCEPDVSARIQTNANEELNHGYLREMEIHLCRLLGTLFLDSEM